MQIHFNGKAYNSIEEMPADQREVYEHLQQMFVDANGNGIPDILEGDAVKNILTTVSSNFVFNGKVYHSLDELPPEIKEKVQKALGKLQQAGIVNAADLPQVSADASSPSAFEPAFQPSKPILTQEPPNQESGSKNWMLILGFLAALFICAVGFAIIVYLRR